MIWFLQNQQDATMEAGQAGRSPSRKRVTQQGAGRGPCGPRTGKHVEEPFTFPHANNAPQKREATEDISSCKHKDGYLLANTDL